MAFTILYHPAVAKEDIPQIPKNLQRRIATAIETRLTKGPELYGAPLRKTLKGTGNSAPGITASCTK